MFFIIKEIQVKNMNLIRMFITLFFSVYFFVSQAGQSAIASFNQELLNALAHSFESSDTVKYKAINHLLSKYKRPFTVLEVGATNGFFSFKGAQDYPASVFAMIEGFRDSNMHYSNQLYDDCRKNRALKNIILLRRSFTIENLEHLATCEHFDVVFGFNILHQFGSQWQRYADAVLKLGDNVFIEVSIKSRGYDEELLEAIENYLIKNGGIVINENRSEKTKLYLFAKNKTSISRKYWVADENTRRQLKIISNFEHKFIVKSHKNYTRISPWIPGINLLTFKMMNGKYPRIRTLKRIIKTFANVDHPDPFIWNLVLQGTKVELIDWDPIAILKFDPFKCAKFNLLALSLNDQQTIKQYILQFNKEREKYTKCDLNILLDRILEKMADQMEFGDFEFDDGDIKE